MTLREGRRGPLRQVDISPAKKEPTVKNRAYSVSLAVLVALMAASGASAKSASVHAAKQADRYSASRAAPSAKQFHGASAKAKPARRGGRHF